MQPSPYSLLLCIAKSYRCGIKYVGRPKWNIKPHYALLDAELMIQHVVVVLFEGLFWVIEGCFATFAPWKQGQMSLEIRRTQLYSYCSSTQNLKLILTYDVTDDAITCIYFDVI